MEWLNVEEKFTHPKDLAPEVLKREALNILNMKDARIKGTEEEIHQSIIAIIRALGPEAFSRNIIPVLRHFYSNEEIFRGVYMKMWGYEIGCPPGGPWYVVEDKRAND